MVVSKVFLGGHELNTETSDCSAQNTEQPGVIYGRGQYDVRASYGVRAQAAFERKRKWYKGDAQLRIVRLG